jgi:hypothetical protein
MAMHKFLSRSLHAIGAAAVLSVATAQANAQTAAYFERPAFTAALATVQINDLNALVNGSTSISFGTLGTGTLTGATVSGGAINNTGTPFTFSITFSQLVNGFGAEFNNAQGGRAATFSLFNGATLVGMTGLYGGTGFLGTILTGGAFNRISISEVPIPGNGASLFSSLDNVTVGVVAPTLPPTTVPEPASFVLMGAGLAVVGMVARRRSNKSANA